MKTRKEIIMEVLLIDKNLGAFKNNLEWNWLSNLYLPIVRLRPFFQTYAEYVSFKYWIFKTYRELKVLNDKKEASFPFTIILAEALSGLSKTKMNDEDLKLKTKIYNDRKYEKLLNLNKKTYENE